MKKTILILAGLAIAGFAFKDEIFGTSSNALMPSGNNYSQYNDKSFLVKETGQAFITKDNERYYNAFPTSFENWFVGRNPSDNLGYVTLEEVKNIPIVGHVNAQGVFVKDGLYYDPQPTK